MLDKTQELTRLLDDANQYLTACPPVNDSNVFGELAKCLEQIHVKVYQVHGMVDEIKTLAPKLNTINVRVNIDSFKLECHSVNRHRFLSSPLTTPSKPEEVEVKRLRI
jgi:hypothetical protein